MPQLFGILFLLAAIPSAYGENIDSIHSTALPEFINASCQASCYSVYGRHGLTDHYRQLANDTWEVVKAEAGLPSDTINAISAFIQDASLSLAIDLLGNFSTLRRFSDTSFGSNLTTWFTPRLSDHIEKATSFAVHACVDKIFGASGEENTIKARIHSKLCQQKAAMSGVNLGGWLVVERWMSSNIYQGTTAQDEMSLCRQLGVEEATNRFTAHRSNYITEKDFEYLSAAGILSVRLPFGSWALVNFPPFVSGGEEYIHKAMKWGEAHNVKVFLDLHSAPGFQSGEQHTGCQNGSWSPASWNVSGTIDILKLAVKKFSGYSSYAGMYILNEPSTQIAASVLIDFYRTAYKELIPISPSPIIGAVFIETRWPEFNNSMPVAEYPFFVYDFHYYQCFGGFWASIPLTSEPQQGLIIRYNDLTTNGGSNGNLVSVSEWSARLNTDGKLNDQDTRALITDYLTAQFYAYSVAAWWSYWTYKVDNNDWQWSFKYLLDNSIMPKWLV